MAVIRVHGEFKGVGDWAKDNLPRLLSSFPWYNWIMNSRTGSVYIRRQSDWYVDIASRAMGFSDHMVANYAVYITFSDEAEAMHFKLLHGTPDLYEQFG